MGVSVSFKIPRPLGHVFTYPMIPLRVVDGDTFDCVLDRGFGETMAFRCRLAEVDAPEISGKNASPEGKVAKQYVVDWFLEREGTPMVLHTAKGHPSTVGIGDGAFGRWLGDVWPDTGLTLAQDLVQAGLAARGFAPEFFQIAA